jgi:hypothetical protein
MVDLRLKMDHLESLFRIHCAGIESQVAQELPRTIHPKCGSQNEGNKEEKLRWQQRMGGDPVFAAPGSLVFDASSSQLHFHLFYNLNIPFFF